MAFSATIARLWSPEKGATTGLRGKLESPGSVMLLDETDSEHSEQTPTFPLDDWLREQRQTGGDEFCGEGTGDEEHLGETMPLDVWLGIQEGGGGTGGPVQQSVGGARLENKQGINAVPTDAPGQVSIGSGVILLCSPISEALNSRDGDGDEGSGRGNDESFGGDDGSGDKGGGSGGSGGGGGEEYGVDGKGGSGGSSGWGSGSGGGGGDEEKEDGGGGGRGDKGGGRGGSGGGGGGEYGVDGKGGSGCSSGCGSGSGGGGGDDDNEDEGDAWWRDDGDADNPTRGTKRLGQADGGTRGQGPGTAKGDAEHLGDGRRAVGRPWVPYN